MIMKQNSPTILMTVKNNNNNCVIVIIQQLDFFSIQSEMFSIVRKIIMLNILQLAQLSLHKILFLIYLFSYFLFIPEQFGLYEKRHT